MTPEPLTDNERQIALDVAAREGGDTQKWLNLVLLAYDGLERRLAEKDEALRHANFFRDRLADRLRLVETAVVELDGALSCDEAIDSAHWREHARHAMESALRLCRKATRSQDDLAREALRAEPAKEEA